MNLLRILIVSRVRPSRAWKIADLITRDVLSAEISGIVQCPFQQLPLLEQVIANRSTRQTINALRLPSGASRWFRSVLERLADRALWWVHGCPRKLNGSREYTLEKLEKDCIRAGWPFLPAENGNDARVLDFIRQKNPSLLILLGELPPEPALSAVPLHGLLRVSRSEIQNEGMRAKEGFQIRIEHFTRESQTPITIASLTLPVQPYDGLLGLTLKTDLISDDLLVRTAEGLRNGSSAQASKETAEWAQKIFSPYLAQLEQASVKMAQSLPFTQRSHSVWKLCMHSLLLCSPWVVARNWLRRWRGQYPVLILAHHLVADRPHRMGMSTETFWRQICFLRRHYRIVSLSEAVEFLRSGDIKTPTLALTFDDGYGDNFVSLRAVAEEAGIPVALFVTSQPIENHQEFQHDLMRGIRGFLPLTWEQIRYWSLGRAEFGSHTRTHLDCGSTERARLEPEIVGSKIELESELGMPVPFFAFPYGKDQNISPDAVAMAASAYPYFVSSMGGENRPDGSVNRRHLFRKNHFTDLWELELELQSRFNPIEAVKREFPLGCAKSPGLLAERSLTSWFAASGKET